MILWALIGSSLAATPSDIRTALVEFNANAVFALPILSDVELDRLAAGEVVSLLTRGHSEEAWRSVGLIVAQASQQEVWLSCQDPHFENANRVTERRLAGGDHTDRATWYGHLDLPAPISDRHWVVNVWNNHNLATVTQGRMWEHPWRLHDDGISLILPYIRQGVVGALTEESFHASIYTPVNNGAWVAIQLSDQETLLAYHGATDIGGVIPGKLVAQFSASGMHDMLMNVADRARDDVAEHYRGNHILVLGGDGRPMPLYP